MSDLVNKQYQATFAATLEQQIIDPNFPKNEREWWAAARIAQLEAALRAAYEVYAGSDGFVPETCAEGYQQQIITQMVDCISAALGEERT